MPLCHSILRAMGDWRKQARCKDLTPEEADKLFFYSSGGKSKRGREFCMRCPVKTQCADSAVLGNEEFGIWGAQLADDLKLVGPDRYEKIAARHPEKLASYLESLPPRSERQGELDSNFDDDFDALENPLDSLFVSPSHLPSDVTRPHIEGATFPEAI